LEFLQIILGFAVGIAVWFWWKTMQSREHAEHLARQACQQAHVQLLDGTVSLKKIRFNRDKRGNIRPLRYFDFEFNALGNERRSGVIALLNLNQQYLYMDLPESPTITTQAETIESTQTQKHIGNK